MHIPFRRPLTSKTMNKVSLAPSTPTNFGEDEPKPRFCPSRLDYLLLVQMQASTKNNINSLSLLRYAVTKYLNLEILPKFCETVDLFFFCIFSSKICSIKIYVLAGWKLRPARFKTKRFMATKVLVVRRQERQQGGRGFG